MGYLPPAALAAGPVFLLPNRTTGRGGELRGGQKYCDMCEPSKPRRAVWLWGHAQPVYNTLSRGRAPKSCLSRPSLLVCGKGKGIRVRLRVRSKA